MKARTRRLVINSALIILALLLSMLLGILVTYVSADGPWLWQEKCPTLHYEVRIDQVQQRGMVTVSCVRMAEEVTR